jgi:hypothetical protein
MFAANVGAVANQAAIAVRTKAILFIGITRLLYAAVRLIRSAASPKLGEHIRIAAASETPVERKVGSEANRSPQGESCHEMKQALPLVALLASTWPATISDLPLNPAVTQETIATTICIPGWTKTVRPSARYTAAIKIKLIRELEIPEELLVDFELDHRIPLALGGAPSDERNLELQPWDEAGEKDRIETCLSRAVCAGIITLDEARRRIWADWRAVGKVCQ